MTDFLIENDLMFSERLAIDQISLNSEQIAWAIDHSQSTLLDPQWQRYLEVLALLSFEQWIQERAPDLSLVSDWLMERRSRAASGQIDTHSASSPAQVQIGEFKLRLVVVETLEDTVIPVVREAIDRPEQMPHLYVLVEVLEELAQARARGYLRHDQLVVLMQGKQLSLEDEQTYLLPLGWFELNPDTLLLYLHCLDPAAISLPVSAPTLAQRAMNVGLWLREQIDTVAEEWNWILLPPLMLNPAMRSLQIPLEQLDQAVTDLIQRHEVEVPRQTARAAYRDLHWANLGLRLYIVTWAMPTSGSTPEWMLLVILNAQPGTLLPRGINIQVRDESQILANPTLGDRAENGYLYAQVMGIQDEQFWVTIRLANGAAITLPPFTFSANSLL